MVQALGILLITLYCAFGLQITSMPLIPLMVHLAPLIAFQLTAFLWFQKFNIDPDNERGFLWRGRLLSISAWPVYFLAYIGVIVRRRLAYVVTPKGSGQIFSVKPSLFTIHIVFGTITAVDIVLAVFSGRSAPLIIFWASLNTAIMYGLFFNAMMPALLSVFAKKQATSGC